MHDTTHLWLYFVLVFGIVALPGLDMAFVLASSLVGGRGAGLSAVAGVVAGGVVHVVIGALGIAAVLALWPAMANAMLLAGALYIGWTGWNLLRSNEAFTMPVRHMSGNKGALFAKGMATCLLNPKADVFLLAVFPQFLRPGEGPMWLQASALGVITALTQAGIYGAVALMAVRSKSRLEANPRAGILAARGVGLLLVGTALLTGLRGWQGF